MPEQESPSKKKILTTDNLSTIKEINDYLYQTKLHSSDGSIVLTQDEDTTNIQVNKDSLVTQRQYREDQRNIWDDLDNAWYEIDNLNQTTQVNEFVFYFDDNQHLNIVDIVPDCIDNYDHDGYYWMSINEGQPALWKLYYSSENFYFYNFQQGCIVYMSREGRLDLSRYYGDYLNHDSYSPEIEIYNGEIDWDNFVNPEWTSRDFSGISDGECQPKVWLYIDDKKILADVSVEYDDDDNLVMHCYGNGQEYQFVLEWYAPPKQEA